MGLEALPPVDWTTRLTAAAKGDEEEAKSKAEMAADFILRNNMAR